MNTYKIILLIKKYIFNGFFENFYFLFFILNLFNNNKKLFNYKLLKNILSNIIKSS